MSGDLEIIGGNGDITQLTLDFKAIMKGIYKLMPKQVPKS